ncbi:monovalent cation/H(+) antiporter subunit G [Thioalkalivibrio nitratireducens]|nr:monovalent cation/H(+) antiporter subunit G [Thioalkalivibrio nitratireducens]
MIELLTAVFLVAGAGFMLIAAMGLLRMPDLLTRMHATTKAGVLGAGLIMVGAAIYIGQLTVVVKAIAVVAFLILTAPVAAHAIGRAGYFVGVPLWSQTHTDELKGRYDQKTHTLASSGEKGSAQRDQGARGNRSES